MKSLTRVKQAGMLCVGSFTNQDSQQQGRGGEEGAGVSSCGIFHVFKLLCAKL